ncbi:isoleucine--tRNA ligase [Candidatus Dojkabacteria bacterium]|uniref:Isoleucine--tRNA ligase n=1 Tax=Candidatus Dojkabacteria bacterium TaxID=2099670 RepID=A0A955L1L5_9BACT|nr:isoleucine--tRNA ligase [Candidatus Dojkabacteria bacterium]
MFNKPNPRQKFFDMEQDVLGFWKKEKIFEKSIETKDENNRYTFVDGPPFVTGMPHYGSLLSSITKDPVTRYWTMRGKRIRRVWGWDCHGLPIEAKVNEKFNLKSRADVEEFGIDNYVRECRKHVEEVTGQWEWYIDAIGRWVDMENAYYTMNPEFNESVIWVFKQMYEKGFIYKGKRVSLFSTDTATPVSEFEVAESNNYQEIEDLSIFVKFRLKDSAKLKLPEKDTFLVAWTTTPWTIPSNFALAVNPKATYVAVEFEGQILIIAKDRLEYVFKGKQDEFPKLGEFKGTDLSGLSYEPIYDFYVDQSNENDYKVYEFNGVTTEDGTGVLHVAPGFGAEDYMLGEKYGLSGFQDIDDEGKLLVGDWKGIYLRDANESIRDNLKEKGNLLRSAMYKHRVPLFRGDNPLIYKAQDSYYVDIQRVKDRMLDLNSTINWVPEHFKEGRMAEVIKSAPDWGISRTRYWATIMPIWVNDEGEELVMGSIEEMSKYNSDIKKKKNKKGKEVWFFGDDEVKLHRDICDKIVLTKDGKEYRRIPDVVDNWLDSGSVPIAEWHYPFENKEIFENNFPADYIAEYVGQIRAWFNVLLRVSTIVFDKVPFKNVIVTGNMAGTDGRKMSKSFKNYPDPKATIENYGGDALRLYFLSSPLLVGEDINFNEKELKLQIQETTLPLWNIYTYLTTYANMHNWKPNEQLAYNNRNVTADSHPWDHIPFDDIENNLDAWILLKLQKTIKEVNENMENYQVPKSIKPIKDLIAETSKWYIRSNRDRFADGDERALEVLYYVLVETLKLIAPFTPFISEHIYREIVFGEMENKEESIHLCDYPVADSAFIDQYSQIEVEMEVLRKIVEFGHNLRVENGQKVRQPLSVMYVHLTNTDLGNLSEWMKELLMSELNLKSVEEKADIPDGENIKTIKDDTLGILVGLNIEITEELKKEGATRELTRNIQSERKNMKLNMNDSISIKFETQSDFVRSLMNMDNSDFTRSVKAKSISEEPVGENSMTAKVADEEVKFVIEKV